MPYPKTESAIIVRVMFGGGKVEDNRKMVRHLFRSVQFLAMSKTLVSGKLKTLTEPFDL